MISEENISRYSSYKITATQKLTQTHYVTSNCCLLLNRKPVFICVLMMNSSNGRISARFHIKLLARFFTFFVISFLYNKKISKKLSLESYHYPTCILKWVSLLSLYPLWVSRVSFPLCPCITSLSCYSPLWHDFNLFFILILEQ